MAYYSAEDCTTEIRLKSVSTLAHNLAATAHKICLDNTSDKHILTIRETIHDMIVMLCDSAAELEEAYQELPDDVRKILDNIENNRNYQMCNTTNKVITAQVVSHLTKCLEHHKEVAINTYDTLLKDITDKLGE